MAHPFLLVTCARWLLNSELSTSDVKELTPEFFSLPEFLENMNHCDFGPRQSGEVVNDVHLPVCPQCRVRAAPLLRVKVKFTVKNAV